MDKGRCSSTEASPTQPGCGDVVTRVQKAMSRYVTGSNSAFLQPFLIFDSWQPDYIAYQDGSGQFPAHLEAFDTIAERDERVAILNARAAIDAAQGDKP